jgi:hypothetical protein
MSERRALEYNFLQKLREAFEGSLYAVVESNTYEERKIPCIIVVAGESQPLVDHPEAQDNFRSEINIIVMSSSDEPSPEEHMNVVDKVRSVIMNKADRRKTKVKFLYIYEIYYQNVMDMREERRFATSMNFEVQYNYNANPSVSQ